VRLFTRNGYDWSARYPAVSVTATLLRARWFILDGEAVVCGPDGVAIFDALHRRGTVTEDLRALPLVDRKKRPSGRRLGIVLSEHTTTTARCSSSKPALEGIASKRPSARYRWARRRTGSGKESGEPGDDPGTGSRVVTQWHAHPPCRADGRSKSSSSAGTLLFLYATKTRAPHGPDEAGLGRLLHGPNQASKIVHVA
jgi:hypothetical protein